MGRYTKKQRHEIYKRALAWLLGNKMGRGVGLCYALCTEVTNHPYDKLVFLFPELRKYEPKVYDWYWFPLSNSGHSTRLAILSLCIEETSK